MELRLPRLATAPKAVITHPCIKFYILVQGNNCKMYCSIGYTRVLVLLVKGKKYTGVRDDGFRAREPRQRQLSTQLGRGWC